VAGIPIRPHYSWFIIATLIAVSLAAHFSTSQPEWSTSLTWSVSVLTAAGDRIPVSGSGGFTSYSDERLREQLQGWAVAACREASAPCCRAAAARAWRDSAATWRSCSTRSEIETGIPIVVLEPSCAAVFQDELQNLFPNHERARRLGR
jgi:hypothetical protein